jgi:hypothetical protein
MDATAVFLIHDELFGADSTSVEVMENYACQSLGTFIGRAADRDDHLPDHPERI